MARHEIHPTEKSHRKISNFKSFLTERIKRHISLLNVWVPSGENFQNIKKDIRRTKARSSHSEVFRKKGEIRKIHRKTPVPESPF